MALFSFHFILVMRNAKKAVFCSVVSLPNSILFIIKHDVMKFHKADPILTTIFRSGAVCFNILLLFFSTHAK